MSCAVMNVSRSEEMEYTVMGGGETNYVCLEAH